MCSFPYSVFFFSFQLIAYKMLNVFGMVWGIVGASLIGSSGICVNYGEAPDVDEEDARCYNNVNLAENRSIAIVSVILHVFGCLMHFIFGLTGGYTLYSPVRPSVHLNAISKSRGKLEDPTITRYKFKPKPEPFVPLPRLKPIPALTLAESSTTSSSDDEFTLYKEVKNKSRTKPKYEETAKTFQKVRRQTSLFTIDVERNKHDLAMKRGTTNAVIPPPRGHPHPPTMTDGNSPRLPSLTHRLGDEKMTGRELRLSKRISADDLLKRQDISKPPHALKQRSSYMVNSFKHGDRPPPPAYEETVNADDRQYPVYVGPSPYILPPPPLYDPRDLTAPANVYNGSSYPDTDLIARKPSDFHHERY